MRISDWSSDVCSSDLRRCTRATGRPSPTSSTAGWPRARQPADSAFAAPDAGSGRYSQPVQWGAIPVPRQLIGQAQLFVREAAARNRQEEEAGPEGRTQARSARSEEHTSELQSLMRISYA